MSSLDKPTATSSLLIGHDWHSDRHLIDLSNTAAATSFKDAVGPRDKSRGQSRDGKRSRTLIFSAASATEHVQPPSGKENVLLTPDVTSRRKKQTRSSSSCAHGDFQSFDFDDVSTRDVTTQQALTATASCEGRTGAGRAQVGSTWYDVTTDEEDPMDLLYYKQLRLSARKKSTTDSPKLKTPPKRQRLRRRTG